MSKTELLEQISKLTPEQRGEIWDAFWTLEERGLLASGKPSDSEKAVLDREMEDFSKVPVGTSESSPAIYRRVFSPEDKASRRDA